MSAATLEPRPPPPTRFSKDDERYVRSTFVSLAEVGRRCGVAEKELRDWQAHRLFPLPTYVTSDGTEWYPPAYAIVVRRGRSRGVSLRDLFYSEFRMRLASLKKEDTNLFEALRADPTVHGQTEQSMIGAYWDAFLSGEYGACLKVPWVSCMIQKERLMRRIDLLIAGPDASDGTWRARLRRAVESLDRLEQPFAEWDRIRFGKPLSRDTRITAVRMRYPEVFQIGAKVRRPARANLGIFESGSAPDPAQT